MESKNYNGGSTGQRKKFDDIFTHLDTINTNVTRRTPPTVENAHFNYAWRRAVKYTRKAFTHVDTYVIPELFGENILQFSVYFIEIWTS